MRMNNGGKIPKKQIRRTDAYNLWLLKQGFCPDCSGRNIGQDTRTAEYFCRKCGFVTSEAE